VAFDLRYIAILASGNCSYEENTQCKSLLSA
jgi:hypothetical protein